MIKTHIIAKVIAVFLALTVRTASAATLTIGLDQAYTDLLDADPGACTLGETGSGCPIPVAGVAVDNFIKLLSPNGAFLEETDQGTFLVFSATPTTDPVLAGFAFDETLALVSAIRFNSATTGALGCTAVEDAGSAVDCTSSEAFIQITGNTIVSLNLDALEAFTDTFNVTYTAVPVPAAFTLFLCGLAGLAGVAARKEWK